MTDTDRINELLRHAGPGWQAVCDKITEQAYPVNDGRAWVQWSPGAIATYALSALREVVSRDVRP